MKRLTCFLLALFLLLPLTACDNTSEVSQEISKEESEVKEENKRIPALLTSVGKITFQSEFINSESISSEGYYLYTSEFLGATTPETDLPRMDFTVAEDFVVQVWDENVRGFIPEQNGFTVVCVGEDAVLYASNLNVGFEVDTDYIDTEHLSTFYAVVDGVVININKTDGIRAPEGVCTLYTPAYGKTTGTNIYGCEIVVEDGVVTKVTSGVGNNAIPEKGYVISIHKDHDAYYRARHIKTGAKAELFSNGPAYSVTVLPYNGINGVRGENQVIIYRNQASTNTNMYGYEISVGSDGLSLSEGYTGNMAIPSGGFVVSAHGTAVSALENAYMRGQTVKVDSTNKRVIIINTPDLCINSASDMLNTALNEFDAAKKAYLSIPYTEISQKAEHLKEQLVKAENAIKQGDIPLLRDICASVYDEAEILRYTTIESRKAQNRAMWYRAYEKNDEQVRETIEKLVSLNVNTIYLETFYDGYFIGYMDVDGIEHSRNTGDYDALDGFIRIGHEYGIEVHAWCENFFTGYLNKDGTLSSPILNKYSDRLLKDSAGNEFYYYNEIATFVFLNPNDKVCRDLVLEVYRQIIEKYDVDGLHLDYIRFPELNYGKNDYGYNDDIIADFAKSTGITADPRTFTEGSVNKKAWNAFRCGIITSFVGEVYDMICATDPDIWLSCAIYPDQNYAKNSIFQDVETWVNNGWIDEVFSMTYSGDNDYVYENARHYASICKDKCFYSTGLAAFMDTSSLNFAYQLTDVYKAGADGVAVFALSNISPDRYQYQLTLGGFRSPSVQLYRCGDTVKAQFALIKDMLNESDILFASLTNEGKQNILSAIEEIENGAENPSSALQKKAYCASAVSALNGLKNTVSASFTDEKETDAVNEEIDNLIYWLKITEKRISSKS